MDLKYEPTIEDISQPGIRQYLRSKSFSRQRYLEPIRYAFLTPLVLYFVTVFRPELYLEWWIYMIAFAVSWFFNFIPMRDRVSKRILGHMKREFAHKLPTTTHYLITDSKIQCSSMGADIAFDLKDLSEVREDSNYLELIFGDVGLCVIPLRVFQDAGHKASFLNSLKRDGNA